MAAEKKGSKNSEHHGHHIVPPKVLYTVWGLLLLGTALTVAASMFHFGALNYVIGMVIATVKASLVVMFFMGMKYDSNENRVIFLTSFVFVAIFFLLTFTDLFFRGTVEFDAGRFAKAAEARAGAQFKDPWIGTDDLRKRGHDLFMTNCIACHGPEGKGNGPASVSLNPKPRNFTSGDNWKNGRKPSQVFGTISHGLNAMPSFSTTPAADRWCLAHYVLSLGPAPGKDTPEDLQKAGVDTSGKGGGGGEKTLPVDLAIDIMSEKG